MFEKFYDMEVVDDREFKNAIFAFRESDRPHVIWNAFSIWATERRFALGDYNKMSLYLWLDINNYPPFSVSGLPTIVVADIVWDMRND